MKGLALVAAVLTSATWATVLAAQQRDPATARVRPDADGRFSTVSGTSVIRGHVTTDTGAPIRGAEVRVRAPSGRDNRIAITNTDGDFEVRDLLPDRWSVTASKTGFVSQEYGQRRPFSAPEIIELGERRSFTANFTLRRAGAISGRVFDEFGDPVAGARVQVLRSRMSRGIRTLAPTGVGDHTDDTGAFRLYALPPGDYYVGASLRAMAPESSGIEAMVGAPTYFPGTPSIGEAERIRLGAGEEQSNISFSLLPVRPVRVSGVVLTSTGAPAEDASVTLQSTSDVNIKGTPLGNFGMTQADGAFTIVNVSPGSYLLNARVGAIFDPMEGRGEEALMPLTVGDADVTGLTLTASKSGFITGTIVTESGAPLPRGSMGIRAQSIARGIEFNRRFDNSNAASRTNTFRLPAPLGGLKIDADTLPDGWMLKSIEVNGTDVIDAPIEIRGSQTVEARITITDRVTQVSGTVTMGAGAAPDARVIVLPDESAKWAYPSRYVRSAATDQQGRFQFRALPPYDRYLAIAVDYLEDGELEDPEFLERLREAAIRFSIDLGERPSLTLKLVERQ